MLKRKKKIIAKVMATTMLASTLISTYSISADALESRATVNTTTIAGVNRYETAVKISENGWTTATNAVLINGENGLVDALTATPYANLKNAPILITHKDKLTPATKTRLTKMGVKNVDIVGGTSVVSEKVVEELKAMKITVNRISGINRYETATAVANAMDKISDVSKIAVVNGITGLPDAVSIAAPAANNKMPILLVNPKSGLNPSAKDFIKDESISKSYVIGQTAAVSDSIKNSLPGTKVRLGGTTRQATNAEVIEEFYTSKSLNNIYVAKSGQVQKSDELVDALAVGVLAAKKASPVMIVGKSLDSAQETLLENKEFSNITVVGAGVPSASIDAIKDTQNDPEAKVTSITMVDYKTIKIVGTELNRLNASNISISGNTVKSYTVNTAGTEATVEFNNAFVNGTNTVKIKSNLGNTTTHTFTYSSEISSVQATTKEVAPSGIQYLEFTVNGNQKKSIEELNALGWTVEFKSSKEIFYNQSSPESPTTKSNNGKLKVNVEEGKTTPFENGEVFDYEVIVKKGTTELKSGKVAVTVVAKVVENKEIKSFDINLGDIKLTSNKLVVDEQATIENLICLDKEDNEVRVSHFTITSSNPEIVSATTDKKLIANSTGTANITLKAGNLTKTFEVTVVSEARQVKSVSLSSSSIKLVVEEGTDVLATVKDQYGDPINTQDLYLSDIKVGENIIATAAINQIDGDTEGKVTLRITAASELPEGKTTLNSKLYIKKSSTDTTSLNSMTVYVSNDKVAKTWKLNLENVEKDTTLDMYSAVNDNKVILNLNKYNAAGYLLGNETDISTTDSDGENIWVKSSNTDIATVAIEDGKVAVNTATKTGSTTIKVYKDTKEIASISITVKDTTPKITSIAMNTISNINKNSLSNGSVKFNIEDLFNTTVIGGKKIVEGISMTGTKDDVLLKVESEKVTMYIDNNGKELVLATIYATTDFGKDIYNGSLTLAQEDNDIKGNIIVKIYHGLREVGENPFIIKAISVDIPKNN